MIQTDAEFAQIIQIGIAIVTVEDQVLVGQRSAKVHLAGFAEFPGGKCEPGESASLCAIRECHEETSLTVKMVELLWREEFAYEARTVDLSFFLCEPVNEFEITKVSQPFRWVKIHQLAELNFPEGNLKAVQKLIERYKCES